MNLNKLSKNEKINWIGCILITILSAFVYSIGVVLFISRAKLLSSGVAGISLIIGRLIEMTNIGNLTETQISGVLYFILNLPIIYLCFKKFSVKFSVLTIIHMVFTSLFTSLINIDGINNMLGIEPTWAINNQLECALFAGIFCGFSTAVSYLVGGSSAGIDVLAAYLSDKKQISVGKINALVNGGIIFLSIILWHKDGEILNALFTLVYIFINAIVIDFIFVTNKKVIITIITEKGDEIAEIINVKFTRGVTRIKAIGNYSKREKDFLYTACTSVEALEISKLASEIDEHSFTSISTTQKITGYFLNKKK